MYSGASEYKLLGQVFTVFQHEKAESKVRERQNCKMDGERSSYQDRAKIRIVYGRSAPRAPSPGVFTLRSLHRN